MPVKRKFVPLDDPDLPTKVCPHCKKSYVPLLRLYGGKNYGFFYDQKYCSTSCSNKARSNGGYLDRHGYRVLPSGKRNGPWIYEHRQVMEQVLGRKLTKKETVHHINGDRSDNRPENLELWSSRHGKGQRVSDREPHWLPIYGAAMTLF